MDLAILGLAMITKQRRKVLSGAPILKTAAAATIRHIQYCRKTWASRNAQAVRGDFLYLLSRLSPTMSCTDARDRVYAYLSLQPETSQPIRADYALSVEDVFMICSKTLAAASKILDIFAHTRYPPIGPDSESSILPSWAIDWRLPSTISGLTRSVASSFCASGSFSYSALDEQIEPSGGILTVRGNVLM
ncbi:hypothetical protein QBC34DRAFT_458224 [Podospora aff. communis PSN243]|uniref:Uncharacterized protein n=1 Tax=Podospora aff. communis PSN243 TaxID=3040156 RepID=A0AAV9GUQ3_9PEZI|nr:hypothetical protein QBC34DRAFT_458224 [Podospora aff. communis PSN243]